MAKQAQTRNFVVTQGQIYSGDGRKTAGMKVKLAVDKFGRPDVSVRSMVDMSKVEQKLREEAMEASQESSEGETGE